MVKSLLNLCISKIALHPEQFYIKSFDTKLTRQNREQLLRHMSCHQQIVPSSLTFVTSVLAGKSLRRVELHYSSYVNDCLLECIAEKSSSIDHLSIVNCKNVTGKKLNIIKSAN